MRFLAAVLLALSANIACALDVMTEADVCAFLDEQTTHVMRKELDPLMALFAPEFRHLLPAEGKEVTRDEYSKIQNANFIVAKLILNTIELRQIQLREDGKQAIIRTHNRSRYLIQVKDKQDLIEQNEDLIGELVLRDGRIVYLSTEKL
ncbi:MAG TPA: hypothetical protein VFW42_08425 [Fluviicoccus sp.]|nr:hypothetical protein [Fluviicoccus sp.]